MNSHFDGAVSEGKLQTASRRACSLHKDRADYKLHSEASSKCRSRSAGPRGSDFSAPHRAARVATRSLLSHGAIAAGEDMPQVSMGCEGTWRRWIKKPSVSQISNCDAGEVDIHVYYATNLSTDSWGSASAQAMASEAETDCPATFSLSLNDQSAFPALPRPAPKLAKVEAEEDLTPEKSRQARTKRQAVNREAEEELQKDWIVVSDADAEKADFMTSGSKSAFDGQHPRNVFAKNAPIKHATPKADSQEAECRMDWSSAGMPTALIKRLIHGSANGAHRGPRTEKDSAPLPMNILRAQNLGSAKRERSAPKSPRANSNSRAMKHTGGRR